LGLELEKARSGENPADGFIDLLVETRTEVRTQKLWPLSDRIRDRLAELGVIIEDSKEGTSWRWK
jgi:cysteinyl-tRNA synthetase